MRSDRMVKDYNRFKKIGEEAREDLEEFINYKEMRIDPEDETATIPLKVAALPSFEYLDEEEPRVGKSGEGEEGQPEPGDIDPEAMPEEGEGDGDGDEPGEPGEDEGEHGSTEMNPEEFAEQLDEELGLDLEPKGKQVAEEVEGGWNKIDRHGTDANIDRKRSFLEKKKRSLAIDYDKQFAREALKVEEKGPRDVFEYLLSTYQENVSQRELELMEEELSEEELDEYMNWDELEDEVHHRPPNALSAIETTNMKDTDKRYRKPEIEEEKQKNVVVANIRDVSGSMGEVKKDLVSRALTTIDFYLKGKYDNAEFVYIAHDTSAEEVESSHEFFTMDSGGGTKISSGYEAVQDIFEERYDWDEWNRYVFAAGDGENKRDDSETVMELMDDIPVNRHGYIQTQPRGGGYSPPEGFHAEQLEKAIDRGELEYDTKVAHINDNDEVVDAVKTMLDGGDNDA